MQRTTVFLDIETTGTHLRRRPWEIALIQRVTRDGAPVDREILMQITPIDQRDSNPDSLDIGRFFARHVDQLDADADTAVWRPPAGPRPSLNLARRRALRAHHERLIELVDHVVDTDALDPGTTVAVTEADAAAIVAHWTAGADIIGLNPWFDTSTLSAMLARHNFAHEPWDYHLTNIATEAAAWLRGQLHTALPVLRGLCRDGQATEATALLAELTRLPRRTGRLSELCGVEPPTAEEVHTALGDARWMRRWWDAITPTEVGAHV